MSLLTPTSVFQNYDGARPSTLAFPQPVMLTTGSEMPEHLGRLDSLGVNVSHAKVFLPVSRDLDKFFLDAPVEGKGNPTVIGKSFGPAGTVYRTVGQQLAYTNAPVQEAEEFYYEHYNLFPPRV